MKRILFFSLIFVHLFFGSCKKIDLMPTDGDPVFSASMLLDNTSHEWMAGVNDYYMFAEYEKDPQNVYTFSARLEQEDSCCGEVLTIKIRDFAQLPQGLPQIGESLNANRDYGFAYTGPSDSVMVITPHFLGWEAVFNGTSSFVTQGAPIYLWNFGDSATFTSSEAVVSHTYDSAFSSQVLPVTLTVASTNSNNQGSLTKNVEISDNPDPDTCSISIVIDNPVNPQQLIAIPQGIQPFLYTWSDGGNSSVVDIDTINNPVNMSVTVTDATGCSSNAAISVELNQGTIPNVCVAMFDYAITPIIQPDTTYLIIPADSLQFSKVVIEYTSADGHFYSTALYPQETSASFDLLSVEDYDDNEKGDKTKKLTLQFNCKLWDAQGNFLDLKEGKAVVAVAHPD